MAAFLFARCAFAAQLRTGLTTITEDGTRPDAFSHLRAFYNLVQSAVNIAYGCLLLAGRGTCSWCCVAVLLAYDIAQHDRNV